MVLGALVALASRTAARRGRGRGSVLFRVLVLVCCCRAVLSSVSSLLSLLLVCLRFGCGFRFWLVPLALGVGQALAGPLGVAAGWL